MRTNYTAIINILPNEILLDIFDHIRLSRTDLESMLKPVWKWHVLVHVCRRWRQIVFASPLRLNLELLCTNGTPVRDYLDYWPAFPIVIDYTSFRGLTPCDEDNIIVALEHRTRIHQIHLPVSMSLWSKMATVMQEPFPALTSLSVSTRNVPCLLPVGFLGGSAPRLREIRFQGFPSPTFLNLFPHTSDLVKLDLADCDGHLTGGVSLAESMTMLHKLKSLSIRLDKTLTSRTQVFQPRTTWAVLPSLTSFSFDGGSAYLEDFVARIDAPELNSVKIQFWDPNGYQIPQLSGFLNRTALKESRLEEAKLYFDRTDNGSIKLNRGPGRPPFSINVAICEGINYQLHCVAQVLCKTSAMYANVVRLEIEADDRVEGDEDHYEDLDLDLDNVYWPELLGSFIAVETLHVKADSDFAESIVHALEDTRVLPALNLLYFKGVGVGAGATAGPFVLPGRDCTVHYEELDSGGSD